MGDKKEQEQSAQGTPNPWIYNVSKMYPDQQSTWVTQQSALPERLPLPPARQRRGGLLWIMLLVLLLVIAAVVVGILLFLK